MMKVLLVDDDPISLKIVSNALCCEGYEVVCAQSADEALELLDVEDCRLVISDWEMPGTSGLDLCRKIRQKSAGTYTYFIFLTSHRVPEDIVKGLAAGADDFISKPFQPEELILRCEAGLRVLSLESRDVVIFALAKLAESRDNETGQHIERVQRYCGLLAKTLRNEGEFPNQIDSEFIRLLFETCPLHDIGKVAIPDAILLKPGLLTKEEFEIMKTHTTIGAQTLQAALDRFPTAKFLQCAVDIAWSHHEKFDGSGYPRGLKGDDIPLTARIVAVADVYDALTSKRVYKEAYSHSTAVELIREQSGKHFDPRIVRCFELSADGFNTIREEHQDTEKDLKFPYMSKPANAAPNSAASSPSTRN